MNPVQYPGVPAQFSERRDRLNAGLAFAGMEIGVDGKTRNVTRASDLDGALQRASRLLVGVSALDPFVFALTPLLLAGVALLAAAFPARRASQLDPLVALRDE